MYTLHLDFISDEAGGTRLAQIQFLTKTTTVGPTEAFKGHSKPQAAFIELCLEHLLWEARKRLPPRPFTDGSHSAKILFDPVRKRSKWLSLIFNDLPLNLLLANTGSRVLASIIFTEEVSLHARWLHPLSHGETLSEPDLVTALTSLTGGTDEAVPLINFGLIKENGIGRTEISHGDDISTLSVAAGDEIELEITCHSPSTLAVLWIDSSSTIHHLHPFGRVADVDFQNKVVRQGQRYKIIVSPPEPLTIDGPAGSELCMILKLKSPNLRKGLDELTRALSKSFKKSPLPCRRSEWLTLRSRQTTGEQEGFRLHVGRGKPHLAELLRHLDRSTTLTQILLLKNTTQSSRIKR